MTKISYIVDGCVDIRQRQLAEKMAAHPSFSVLHLVPTRGRVIDLEADPEFWLSRRQNTLTGMIHRIFEQDIRYERYGDFRHMDENLRALIVEKAIDARGKDLDGLTYFSSLIKYRDSEKDFPGIYRAITSFFSRLVVNNCQDVYVENLSRKIDRLESRMTGLGEDRFGLEIDLAWLFADYEEIKRETKLYDNDDVFSSVRYFLENGGMPSFAKNINVMIFDGFLYLSRIEEDILFHLFRLMDEVWWLVDYDGHGQAPIEEFKNACNHYVSLSQNGNQKSREAFAGNIGGYTASGTIVSLMNRLEEVCPNREISRTEEKSFANPMAEFLFNKVENPLIETNHIRIGSFVNMVEEVRAIASEIKRIIHEEELDTSCDLGRIRVVFPELNQYSSIISEVFHHFGIPFSLTTGSPLTSHPITDFFLNIFKIPINGFRREDVFRLFSCNMIQRDLNQGSESEIEVLKWLPEEYFLPGDSPSDVRKYLNDLYGSDKAGCLDIFFLDKVLRKCGLNAVGGISRDQDKGGIQAATNFYREKVEYPFTSQESYRIRLEYYRFLIHFVLLGRKMEPFVLLAEQENPQDISSLIDEILDGFGFPGILINIPSFETGPERREVREIIRCDIKAYSLLKDLIISSEREVSIYHILFESIKGLKLLSKYYEAFRRRLNDSYILDERNQNVIRISQWLELRGRAFDYIFAGGMTSDDFPLKDSVDFIRESSLDSMFRDPDNNQQSRYLFLHVLKNFRKRLYISYPRYREEKEARASQVLFDLESMIRARMPDFQASNSMEACFKWEDNPYFTSIDEMLRADVKKADLDDPPVGGLFPTKNIIVTSRSAFEGLIRGVRSLACRWAVNGLFEYDGIMDGAASYKEYPDFRETILSSSQLELLANCPMRYLFERVYKLEIPDERDIEASPRDMGEFLHGVLNIFYKRLCEDGTNVGDIGIDRAFSGMRNAIDEYLNRACYLTGLEFFKYQKKELTEGLSGDGERDNVEERKQREGVLARLLRFEETAFQDMIPVGVEYEFGYDRPPARMGNVSFRGLIDRFDIPRNDRGRFFIYDYKSGMIPSGKMVKKGLSFQLPLYMSALRSGLGTDRVTAALYLLKKDAFEDGNPLRRIINDHSGGDGKGLDISGVRLLDDFVDRLMDLVGEGCFHFSPDGTLCDYCEYRYACYRDERRMKYLLESETDHKIYSGEKNLEKWKEVDQFRKDWGIILKSMEKALNLKSSAGRGRHFDLVMDFKNRLNPDCHSLPFHTDYIIRLSREIDDFEERYLKQ